MICYPQPSGISRHIDGIGGIPQRKNKLSNVINAHPEGTRFALGVRSEEDYMCLRTRMLRLGGIYVARRGAFAATI